MDRYLYFPKKTDCPRRAGRARPTDWLLPANPRYYDVEQDFTATGTILWHQRTRVHAGDFVYLYMGAPVSAIRYRCVITDVDLPDEKREGRKVMRLRLLCRYDPSLFPLPRLRQHGIVGVRSARCVPYGLLCELERAAEHAEKAP